MNDFRSYSAAFMDHQNELMHYGVRGMKWGIRRYQNPDGSLTPLGRKRYNEEEDLIKFHYETQTNKANKKLDKINKKLLKNPNNSKLQNKKKLTEKEKEAYSRLAKAEIEKLYKTSYKEVLKNKDKARSQFMLENFLLGPMYASADNWSVLSSKERMKIIDDVMKSSGRLNKNRIYNNSGRFSYSFKPVRRK